MTTSKIEYDPTTLMGLSDHVFIKTTVATPYLKNRRTTSNDSHDQKIIYMLMGVGAGGIYKLE